MDMEQEVKEAYEVTKRIDVLDVSVSMFENFFGMEVLMTISVMQRARRSGWLQKTLIGSTSSA